MDWFRKKKMDIKDDDKGLEIILYPEGNLGIGLFQLLFLSVLFYFIFLILKSGSFEKFSNSHTEYKVVITIIFVMILLGIWNRTIALHHIFFKVEILQISNGVIKLIKRNRRDLRVERIKICRRIMTQKQWNICQQLKLEFDDFP